MNLRDELSQYESLEKKIHDYFGYIEDWVTIPIKDLTNVYWGFDGQSLLFAYDKADIEKEEYFSYELYEQRFLNTYVYERPDYTMICCDTQCDGNKYLVILDNSMNIDISEFE